MFESVTTIDASSFGAPPPRELRSGLSGLGGRPALHPAWRSDEDETDLQRRLARTSPAPARSTGPAVL